MTDPPPVDPTTGVAFVVWQDQTSAIEHHPDMAELFDPPRYACSLQPQPGHDQPWEDGPELNKLELALVWARSRTTRILVRPAWDPQRHYTADDGPAKDWARYD